MSFIKYQSLKQLGKKEVESINEGTVYLFAKLDGCFTNTSKIMLADGTTKTIGNIVNKKLSPDVMCYNLETKQLERKKVVDWFKYPVDVEKHKEEWVCIGVDRNGLQLSSLANSRIKINVTNNHIIYTEEDGVITEKPASCIKIGDNVLIPSENMSVIQEQVILGSLLGDSSAFPNKNEGCYNGITCAHSIKQKDYVVHKAKLLGELCKSHKEKYSPDSFAKEKYILTSKVDKRTQQAYDLCYENKKKTITRKWLKKLNSLGLAIWYMDDGSMKRNMRSQCAMFHVEGFDLDEQEMIVEYLCDRGYEARLQKSGEYNTIIMSVEGSDRFWTDISQHIIPSMQYKLPDRFQNRYIELDDDIDVTTSLQKRKVISVDKGVSAPNSIFRSSCYKYDIKIEDNHNYFCDGILVHNSNGNSYLVDNEVKAGSRNRELDCGNDNAGFCAYVESNKQIQQFHRDYPNLRLYGEWLVPHTVRDYKDNAWRKFYVFDVAEGKDEDGLRYLTYEEYQPLLERYNIDYIPLIAKLENPSESEIAKYIKEATFCLKEDCEPEGIVAKNYDFINRFGKTVWAKYINPNFTNGSTKHKKVLDIGSVEQFIIDEFVTQHLVEKEFAKILNEVGEWHPKLINRLFHTVYYCVITEELDGATMWNIMKRFKNPTINFNSVKIMSGQKIREIMGDRLISQD